MILFLMTRSIERILWITISVALCGAAYCLLSHFESDLKADTEEIDLLKTSQGRNERASLLRRAEHHNRELGRFRAEIDRNVIWKKYIDESSRRQCLVRIKPILESLKLSGTQLDALVELLVERSHCEAFAGDFAWEAGIEPGSPEFVKALRDADNLSRDEVSKLLGPIHAGLVLDWLGASQMMLGNSVGVVEQDAVTLAEAGFTISKEQKIALASMRYRISKQLERKPARDHPEIPASEESLRLSEFEEEFLKACPAILDPDEVLVLRKWLYLSRRARNEWRRVRAKYQLPETAELQ
jgi:hypothetical protein